MEYGHNVSDTDEWVTPMRLVPWENGADDVLTEDTIQRALDYIDGCDIHKKSSYPIHPKTWNWFLEQDYTENQLNGWGFIKTVCIESAK